MKYTADIERRMALVHVIKVAVAVAFVVGVLSSEQIVEWIL